jgi:SRSO17 transposase
VWPVGEWRSSGERKYYLSNLPAGTTRRALAGAIKARWVCEQGHQQRKEELGLDYFEGRSWTGLHRHALMAWIACAYLQHLRLAEHHRMGRKNADPIAGAAASAKPACGPAGLHRQTLRTPRSTHLLPTLPKTLSPAL